MTSACNIIYNGSNAIADDLNVNYPLYGASCTVSGAMSAAGLINSNTGFAQNNIEILDVTPNGGATDINVSLGYSNIPSAATGFGNVAVGFQAGNAITSGVDNIFAGDRAGKAVTTGGNNVCLGTTSGLALTTASNTIAIGSGSLSAATTAGSNVAIGVNALALSTASPNLAIGLNSRGNSVSGFHNISIGNGSMYNASAANAANYGIAIGGNVLASQTSGDGNVGVGYNSLSALTTGSNNTCLGVNTGDLITTGSNNIIIGGSSNALPGATTTGNANIIIGYNSLPAAAGNSNSILITTTPAITGAGSNTTVVDPNCVATGAASSHILGYNSTTGQVFKSTTVTPALTLTGGAISPASTAGYSHTGTLTASGLAAGVTYNGRVGQVTFTDMKIASAATQNFIINNNLVTGSSIANVSICGCGSIDAGSALVISAVVYGSGTLTVQVRNSGTAATNAANFSITFGFWLLN